MLDIHESRYDRQERIHWWDQSRLAAARVLVVGAGALGNEIVKNLALLGVGEIDIVDMDSIEVSNLARCALFRDDDRGRNKAAVLADAARELNPEVTTRAFTCKVQQLGSAWVRGYDVVIAGLDSREARLWVNAACRRHGTFWIDGAIEGLQGLVRVFGPSGACYECTLGDSEKAAISHRRSCALLSTEEILSGKTPTNSTTASVVAGLEVQEAVKILVGRHDLLALSGRVWRIEGETMMTSVIDYIEDPWCLAHDQIDVWRGPLEPGDSLDAMIAAVDLGGPVEALYFPDDVVVVRECRACGAGEETVGLRPLLPSGVAQCSACGEDRPVDSRTAIECQDDLMWVPWSRWLWPLQEIVGLRVGDEIITVSIGGHDAR